MAVDRISSLDIGYVDGDLSVYPQAYDTTDTLYDAKNNAETVLTNTLPYNGTFVLVEDTSKFPEKGLINIGTEIIYYGLKTNTVFKNLKRAFANSQQNIHSVGTKVSHNVSAEPHNACKDAILNIEKYLGLKSNPSSDSFNGKLTDIERRYLSPKPSFRAYPRKGQTPLSVRFQNFSNNEAARFLWDFGDGSFSTETHPTHTYVTEGNFTIQLQMITSLGGSGIVTKNNYITIENGKGTGFMYVLPEMGTTSTLFEFTDQSEGDIVQRHWNFGDGNKTTIDDPDVHSITHTYSSAGNYKPTLLIIFADQTSQRVTLEESIVVI